MSTSSVMFNCPLDFFLIWSHWACLQVCTVLVDCFWGVMKSLKSFEMQSKAKLAIISGLGSVSSPLAIMKTKLKPCFWSKCRVGLCSNGVGATARLYLDLQDVIHCGPFPPWFAQRAPYKLSLSRMKAWLDIFRSSDFGCCCYPPVS